MVQFTISSEGKVKDVRLLRGFDDELNEEAVRVVSSSPDWVPGRQNGEAVDVTYQFPVIFSLKQSNQSASNPTVVTTSGNRLRAAWEKKRAPETHQSPTTAQLPGTIWVDYPNSDDRTLITFYDGNKVKYTGQSFYNGRRIANASEMCRYSVVDETTIKIYSTAYTDKDEKVDVVKEYTIKRGNLYEKHGTYYSIAQTPEWISDRNTILTYLDLARCQIPQELRLAYDSAINNDEIYVVSDNLELKIGKQLYYDGFVPKDKTLLYLATNPFIVESGCTAKNECWLYGVTDERSWSVALAVDKAGKYSVHFRILDVKPMSLSELRELQNGGNSR